MEALRRDPTLRNAHGELIFGMQGKIADWNGASHYALIDFYEGFIREHPGCRNAYLDIMDQLIDDYRIEEAKTYCDCYAQIDQSYRVPLYRGKIAWQEGKRQEAFAIWDQMEQKFPEEWCVYHNIGDYLLRDGQIEKVAGYYRKAIDIQKAPRYTDIQQLLKDVHGQCDFPYPPATHEACRYWVHAWPFPVRMLRRKQHQQDSDTVHPRAYFECAPFAFRQTEQTTHQ